MVKFKGGVVVGTTNGDNQGGSSYLYPFRLIGLTSTWFIWYIFKDWEHVSCYTWVPLYIFFYSKRYSHHTWVPQVPDRSPIQVNGWGLIYRTNHLILDCFECYPGAFTCILVSGIQCVFLNSPLTRHCFTTNELVQYPNEVSLAPCKHCLHF